VNIGASGALLSRLMKPPPKSIPDAFLIADEERISGSFGRHNVTENEANFLILCICFHVVKIQ
jgi:hypothetical protein